MTAVVTRIAVALAAGLFLATVATASADDGRAGAAPCPPQPPLSSWERATYKTVTFQTAANLADAALFAALTGTGAGAGAVFLAANTASAALLYFPYEMAWDRFGPSSADMSPQTLAAKTVGYQVLTSARNLALTYGFTGAALPSVGFAAVAFAVDSLFYAANELIWDVVSPRVDA